MTAPWRKWQQYYESICHEYREKWETWDEILYDVCRRFYHHGEISGMAAKLGMVGNADPSRFVGKAGRELSEVVDFFYVHRLEMDKIFKPLAGLKEPLNAEKLKKIVSLEGQLVSLIHSLSPDPYAVHSFASKYLHFHNPLVPIYGSRSEQVVMNKEWFPASIKLEDFPLAKPGDKIYRDFCQRYLAIYQSFRGMIPGINAKQIDYCLLAEYYRIKRSK